MTADYLHSMPEMIIYLRPILTFANNDSIVGGRNVPTGRSVAL